MLDLKIRSWGDFLGALTIEGLSSVPFVLIDLMLVPGSKTKGIMSMPFFDPFMKAFIKFRHPNIGEPNVWLWIVDAERQDEVYDLYRGYILAT